MSVSSDVSVPPTSFARHHDVRAIVITCGTNALSGTTTQRFLLIYLVLGSPSLLPVIPLTSTTTPRQQQGFRWPVQGLVAEFGLAEHWPLSAAIRAQLCCFVKGKNT